MNRTNAKRNALAGMMVVAAGLALGGCAMFDPAAQPSQQAAVRTNHGTPITATTPATRNTTETNDSWTVNWPVYPEPSSVPNDHQLPTTPKWAGQQPAQQSHQTATADQHTPMTRTSGNASPESTEVSWSPNTSRISFSEEGADFDPCVSSDGQYIVFASTQHRATADLYIKRVNSKTVTQLTSGGSDNVMPSLSPDGERIAFASNRAGNWDVFVMSVAGGQAVQVTSDQADELHPSWSPDGKNLVFTKLGDMSGRWEMWVAPVQTPASPTFIGYGLFPQWCPVAGTGADGSDKILFQLSRERGNRTFGLWTMDFGNGYASNPTEIASEPNKALINPTWSPDGQWICFAEIPANGKGTAPTNTRQSVRPGATTSSLPATASLWMIGTDGTGKVNLVSGNGASLMPAWGSDGTIYFVSNRGGAENIWSLNSSGAIRAARGTVANPIERPVAGAAESAETTEQH